MTEAAVNERGELELQDFMAKINTGSKTVELLDLYFGLTSEGKEQFINFIDSLPLVAQKDSVDNQARRQRRSVEILPTLQSLRHSYL